MKIFRKLYNWIIRKKMPTPPPIKTQQQILTDLNAEGNGTWIMLDGYFALPSPKIEGKSVDFNFPVRGLVLKGFLNLSTAEVRTFIAKFTDDPKREDLYE